MQKADVIRIVGREGFRETKSALVLEIRPRSFLSFLWLPRSYKKRKEQLVAEFLKSFPKVFICPHEPDDSETRAKVRTWELVADNTWQIPHELRTIELAYPPFSIGGWTLYYASATLRADDWPSQGIGDPLLIEGLIKSKGVQGILVSDPDGDPWLFGVGAWPSGKASRSLSSTVGLLSSPPHPNPLPRWGRGMKSRAGRS